MNQARATDKAAGQVTRGRPASSGAPDYASRDYWENRFAVAVPGSHAAAKAPEFDWLGSGDDLLDPLMDRLGEAPADSERWTLHIGSGSSRAGCQLRRRFEEKAWPARQIVNVDYAPSAIALSQTIEEQCFGNVITQHVVADLLDGVSLREGLTAAGLLQQGAVVGAVLDKSTADAFSTGPQLCSVETEHGGRCFVPEMDAMSKQEDGARWDPVEALAYVLGGGGAGAGAEEARKLWKVTRSWSIEAPSGKDEKDVHAPAVYHRCYLLTRTAYP